MIHKDEDSEYAVTVPVLPCCFSGGSTPEAAIEAAREAIECHIEGLILHCERLPEPRPLTEH